MAFHKHHFSYHPSCSSQKPLPHPITSISGRTALPASQRMEEPQLPVIPAPSPSPSPAACLLHSFTILSFLSTVSKMCSFILPDSQVSMDNTCFGKAALTNRRNNIARFLFAKETVKMGNYDQCGHTHSKSMFPMVTHLPGVICGENIKNGPNLSRGIYLKNLKNTHSGQVQW